VSVPIRKWIRRALIGTVGLFVSLVLVLVFVLGTERGTRWVFDQATAIVSAEIIFGNINGTLLTAVEMRSIRYADGERTVIVSDLLVNIDWTATEFSMLAIERLSIREISLTSSPVEPRPAQPLQLDMPELPIGIRVGQLRLNALDLDGTRITAIVLSDFMAQGQAISLGDATASMDELLVLLRDVSAEIKGDVPVGARFDWRMAGSNWSGTGDLSGSLANLEIRHDLAGDYPLATRGSVELLNRVNPVFDLINEFVQISYEEWSASEGHVRVTGTTDNYRLSFSSSITNEDAVTADIIGAASGSLQGLTELDVSAESDIATLRAVGNIGWSPTLSADLTLTSNGIDPSKFVAVPAGVLNTELRLRATSAEDFVVDIISLSGPWNGQPTEAFGQLSRRDTRWLCKKCRVAVGDNRVNVNGEIKGRSIYADFGVDAPSLENLWPTLAGSLSGNGRLRGTLRLPILSGRLTGKQLVFDDWSLGYLSVESSDSTAQDLDVTVEFRESTFNETTLGAGQLDIAGVLDDAQLMLAWHLDDYAAAANVNIAIDNEVVSGLINTASLTEPVSGTWSLDAPTHFTIGPESQMLAAGSWSNDAAELRHERVERQQDMFSVIASLSNAPLGVLNALLPDNVQLMGQVNATVDLQYGVDGWNGNFDWRQRDTEVRIIASEDDRFDGEFQEVHASVWLSNSAPKIKASLKSGQSMEAILEASLDELSSDAKLQARLQFSGDSWEWVPRLFPKIDDFTGSINADVRASGVLHSPDLQGEVSWANGTLAVPDLNLPLKEIELTMTGSNAGDVTVSGAARSGEGVLRVNGRLENVVSALPSFKIKVSGNQATLLNWEDYLLVASPDLEFSGDTSGVHVTGSVAMDKAEINVRGLPEGAVAPSDDVVVVGRENDTPRKTRVTGAVDILLSDDIHLKAFGLDTNLEGQLGFMVAEGREPRGVGELRLVDGVFEAYGQKLEVETGTMTFTGPLDDPLIEVRAIRKIERISGSVVAGINLSGRAQEIQTSLFSDPSMSQADILSYLVIGRPLEEATAAEGTNLSSSAYSLGLRQAAVIVGQIGQSVGLDELSVGGSNQNTTELIAGKQVSSKVYARYAYGVFSQVGTLLIRYKLTDSFSIEIGAGESQSMDILYTVEKE